MSPWDTWIGIIVHRRLKLRWIFKAECYLLFSFGDFWRGLDKIFSFVMRPAGRNQPTLSDSGAEFWMSDWYICHFPRILGLCFLFLSSSTSWGWQSPTPPLIHKAQSVSFTSVAFGGENKNSIKSHLALAWISLIKKPTMNFLSVNCGHEAKVSLPSSPSFPSSGVGLWLVLCWSSLASICGLLEGNLNYLTCNDVINSYLARCLLINLGREGPRLTRFPAALAALLVL